jgi:Contractile injection system tube protein
MELNKATLRPAKDEKAKEIVFMFNPTELKFSRSINTEQSQGSQTKSGNNKNSFKHPNPYQLTISNIILDTYEQKTGDRSLLKPLKPFTDTILDIYEQKTGDRSVLKPLKPFTDAMAYTKEGKEKDKRPPIYLFTWGTNVYLRCFIKSCNFRLTMFLPDGTPVRAIIDLTLEQADESKPKPSQGTPNVSQADRKSQGRPGLQDKETILQ